MRTTEFQGNLHKQISSETNMLSEGQVNVEVIESSKLNSEITNKGGI